MSNFGQYSQSSQPRSATSVHPSAPEYVFAGKSDNARTLVTILATIQMKVESGEPQMAIIQLTERGMKVTYEQSRSFSGSANLSADLWNDYNLARNCSFKINLSHLLECLTIYSGPQNQSGFTAVHLLYRGEGESLELSLEEGGVQTTCRLRTYEPDDLCPFDVTRGTTFNKIIITGDQLKEAFSEMDWSSEFVKIWMTPTEFRLSSSGSQGTCEIEYPAGNVDLFEEYDCQSSLRNVFKIALLIPAVKSLKVAAKTQLRMNAMGLLSMRHMIRLENKLAFTEFNIVSDVDIDD